MYIATRPSSGGFYVTLDILFVILVSLKASFFLPFFNYILVFYKDLQASVEINEH